MMMKMSEDCEDYPEIDTEEKICVKCELPFIAKIRHMETSSRRTICDYCKA